MTALTAAIGLTETRLRVDTPPRATDRLLQIDSEFVLVRSTGSSVIEVERGALGSTPASHAAAADVTPVVVAVQTSAPSAPPPSEVGSVPSGDTYAPILQTDDAPPWLADTAYSDSGGPGATGECVYDAANGAIWMCNQSGTSGSSEPDWYNDSDFSTTDGTVVWSLVGYVGRLAIGVDPAGFESSVPPELLALIANPIDLTKTTGANLPTADPHVAGALWSDSGVLTVSAG